MGYAIMRNAVFYGISHYEGWVIYGLSHYEGWVIYGLPIMSVG